MTKRTYNGIKRPRLKDLLLLAYDVVAVTVAYFLALWLRFDCHYTEIPRDFLMSWLYFTPFYAVVSIIVFLAFRLYQSIWEFASYVELKRVICASAILGGIHAVAITLIFGRMPISYYIVGTAIQFLLIALIRFSYRFVSLQRRNGVKHSQNEPEIRVMLIGAGTAGQMILRDLHNAKKINERVCCIIDDDKKKHGRYIDGIPIVGGREDILLNVEKYRIENIYLTMPGQRLNRDVIFWISVRRQIVS